MNPTITLQDFEVEFLSGTPCDKYFDYDTEEEFVLLGYDELFDDELFSLNGTHYPLSELLGYYVRGLSIGPRYSTRQVYISKKAEG